MSQAGGTGQGGTPIGTARIDFVGNTAPLRAAQQQAKATTEQTAAEVQQTANKVTNESAKMDGGFAENVKGIGSLRGAFTKLLIPAAIAQGIASLVKGWEAARAEVELYRAAQREAANEFKQSILDVGRNRGNTLDDAIVQNQRRLADELNAVTKSQTEEEAKIRQRGAVERIAAAISEAKTEADIQAEAELRRQSAIAGSAQAEARIREQFRKKQLDDEYAEFLDGLAREQDDLDKAEKREDERIQRRIDKRQKLIDKELEMERRKNEAIARMERDLQSTLMGIRNAASGSAQNELLYDLRGIRETLDIIRQQQNGSLQG